MTPPLLLLCLLLPGPAVAGSVHVDGVRHRLLLPPDAERPQDPPGPVVRERTVELEPLADGVRLRARWRIDTERPGWLSEELIGADWHIESLELDGLTAISHARGRRLIGLVERPHTVELVAVLPDYQPGGGIALRLMGATRGTLTLDDAELELFANGPGTVAWGGDYWSGADDLAVRIDRPLDPDRREQTLVRAQAGVGLTVLEGELAGRARLSWQVLRGEVDTVAFSAEGIGASLELTGDNVRTFSRSGSRVTVELREPTDGRVDLSLSWRDALPEGTEATVPLPRLVPEAFRVEGSLQLARAGDREVLPSLSQVQAIAASSLPDFGEGLIEGTPTAAFAGQATGTLSLLAFEPVAGPPVVVDVAQYTVATSEEGRVLMRALYEVRNERAQWLELTPPPGLRILAARVGADTAVPVTGRDGAWRLPLLRSVETVEGLLTFPVEVALIGEVAPFARREKRELALPTVDAEVAVSRVVLHLPPAYRSRLRPDEAGSVADFTAGQSLSYGFGVGETGAAQADALFQQAVSGWMSNDFDEAQQALDDLREMGADTENVRRLQSNLDLVGGSYRGEADAAMTRRIKDQARARSLEDERRAEDLRREAEEAQVVGSYEQSNQLMEEYLELNERLQKLEQDESVEYAAAEKKALEVVASNKAMDKAKKKANTASSTVQLALNDEGGRLDGANISDPATNTFSFDDYEIEGELASPDGDFVVEGHDAKEASRGQVLTKDFLRQVPVGRDYQSAVGGVAGLQEGEVTGGDMLAALGDEDLFGAAVAGEGRGSGGGGGGSASAPPSAAPAPPSGAAAEGDEYGAAYGFSSGESEPPPPPEPPEEVEEEEPMVEVAAESRRSVIQTLGSSVAVGRRKRAKSAPAKGGKATPTAAPLPPPDTIELFTEEPDVPEVTAASMSVVVPELGGDTVRYQQLLLPAGEAHTVFIRARETRRTP